MKKITPLNKPLPELLLKIRYPASRITAAQDWKCSIELAYQRLYQALQRDLLVKSMKFYVPTSDLLQFWQETDQL